MIAGENSYDICEIKWKHKTSTDCNENQRVCQKRDFEKYGSMCGSIWLSIVWIVAPHRAALFASIPQKWNRDQYYLSCALIKQIEKIECFNSSIASTSHVMLLYFFYISHIYPPYWAWTHCIYITCIHIVEGFFLDM